MNIFRIGIVGASTLLGKELGDVLAESVLAASTVVLLDEDELAGVVTAAGDEAAVVQRLEEGSFEGMDFVFFTGSAALTRARWQAARAAGASLVDLTYALEGESGAVVLAPWVAEATGRASAAPDLGVLDLKTTAVIAAHPAAVMLSLVGARLGGELVSVAATVMEPASEHGKAAMDELHEQTVNLLSFQAVPREQHDAQVAFNLLPGLGPAAKLGAAAVGQRILAHSRLLAAVAELAVQVVHAPVFHGYVVSAMVEVAEAVTVEAMEAALAGAHVDLVAEGSDPPSNLSASGQDEILMQVRAGFAEETGRRFWVWMAADNLKLAALNAVACAVALRRLRPQGTVQ